MGNQDLPQLDDLLTRLCDGGLSDLERAELADELRRSQSARQSYMRYVSLHFWLRSRYGMMKPDSDAEPAPRPEPAVSPMAVRPAGSRWSWPWAAALAASVLVVATLAWMFAMEGSHSPENVAGYRNVAALVTATQDCRWGDGSVASRVGQVLRDHDRVDIRSGAVELQFDSGARVIARGPTTLEVASAKNCELKSGEVVARFEQGNDGFSVTADSLRVVDLGTEFGVRRSSHDRIQLEVFEGEIAVYDTSVSPTRVASGALGILHQGQTAIASLRRDKVANAIQIGARLSGDFLRVMPPGANRGGTQADKSVADGFGSVADGQLLTGLNTGFGWDSPWRSNNVTYRTADVAGFASHATNNDQGHTAVHRSLPWVLDKRSPIYASAHFCIDGADPICTAWVMLTQSSSEPGAGESDLMAFGISDQQFSARLASGSEELTGLAAAKWSGDFGQYAPGEEHWLVAKLEFNAVGDMERLSVWVDPIAHPAGPLSAPTHVVTRDTGKNEVDTVAIRFWEMDGDARGYVDDVRIGTSWRSVVE